MQDNEKADIYKNKVIHNWNEICTIYSKDHATSQGARTSAETETETQTIPPTQETNDISPECAGPSKKPRMGEAIITTRNMSTSDSQIWSLKSHNFSSMTFL